MSNTKINVACSRRLTKELADLKKSEQTIFREIIVDENNIMLWQGKLCPDQHPYNLGAFKIEISFPSNYPFKPPKVTFKTKVYHPNITETGQLCLDIICPHNWNPAIKTDQVIQALAALFSHPEPDHPLRCDLAELYTKDRKSFLQKAADYTKKHAEIRPPE